MLKQRTVTYKPEGTAIIIEALYSRVICEEEFILRSILLFISISWSDVASKYATNRECLSASRSID